MIAFVSDSNKMSFDDNHDPRLVISSDYGIIRDWEASVRGGVSHWTIAEDIIAERYVLHLSGRALSYTMIWGSKEIDGNLLTIHVLLRMCRSICQWWHLHAMKGCSTRGVAALVEFTSTGRITVWVMML